MSNVRVRQRRIQVDEKITDDMRDAVVTVYAANQTKNKAAREEKKAQSKLDHLMSIASDAKEWKFTHVVGNKILDVRYFQGEKEVVDIHKLFKLVEEETFLAAVTVSKKSVVDNCGNNVEAACITTEFGNWKASVKARK